MEFLFRRDDDGRDCSEKSARTLLMCQANRRIAEGKGLRIAIFDRPVARKQSREWHAIGSQDEDGTAVRLEGMSLLSEQESRVKEIGLQTYLRLE